MIKIELNLAVALYLIISILILFIWIISEKRERHRKAEKQYSTLWQCPICFYIYIDSRAENISRCPKCSALHRRKEKL